MVGENNIIFYNLYHMRCCDGTKIFTTTLCKSYNCSNKSTFKRTSTQDNVMEGVFEAQNQKKKKKKEEFFSKNSA